jgi:chorismate mutase
VALWRGAETGAIFSGARRVKRMENEFQTASSSIMGAEILGLRERIDEADRRLVEVLNERARLVREIAQIKRKRGISPFDPKREEEMLRRVIEQNEGYICDSALREIFALIIHRIRDLEVQREEFH